MHAPSRLRLLVAALAIGLAAPLAHAAPSSDAPAGKPAQAKADIVDLLECDDLPANVRKALELRQEAAKTSVSKLTAMVNRASADGRIRGSFMYHGASTGRWSSSSRSRSTRAPACASPSST